MAEPLTRLSKHHNHNLPFKKGRTLTVTIVGPYVFVSESSELGYRIGLAPLESTASHDVKRSTYLAILDMWKVTPGVKMMYEVDPDYVIGNIKSIMSATPSERKAMYDEMRKERLDA